MQWRTGRTGHAGGFVKFARTALVWLGCMALPACDNDAATGHSEASVHPKRAEAATASTPPPVREGFAGITGAGVRDRARDFEHGALVNLWASWCGSCKRELPMLRELMDAYGPHGLGLVTVTADAPEALPKARAMLRTAGLGGTGNDRLASHHYLAGRVSVFKRALDPRWQGAIPASFLVDEAGRVRYFWNGPVLADEIREVVQHYLAGELVDGMTDVTVGQPR